MCMNVDGRKDRGNANKLWMESVKNGMREREVNADRWQKEMETSSKLCCLQIISDQGRMMIQIVVLNKCPII